MTLRITPAELVDQAMKSGNPGLLAIAPGWPRVRLGAVADITNGAPFRSERFNLDGRGLPLIRIRDVKGSTVTTWYEGPWEPAHLVRAGDLLVGMDGDFNAATWQGPAALLNQRVCRLEVTPGYDRRFLELVLPGYLEAIWKATSSTTVKHLSSKSVADIPLPNPPLDEQRRIVDILEDHLSRLDAADRGLSDAIHRSRSLEAAQLARAVEVAARHAEKRVLESVARVGTGTTPRRGDLRYWEGGTIPWVTSGELSQGIIHTASQAITQTALAETSAKIWPAGTLLVAMYGEGKTRGTVGELALAATTNQACAAIALHDTDPAVRAWIRLVLESRYQEMRRAATGGVQPNLNLGHFRAMTVPWPDRPVMEAAVTEMSEGRDRVRSTVAVIEAAAARSTLLRRALLAAAFSGRLTGRSSDLELAEELVDA